MARSAVSCSPGARAGCLVWSLAQVCPAQPWGRSLLSQVFVWPLQGGREVYFLLLWPNDGMMHCLGAEGSGDVYSCLLRLISRLGSPAVLAGSTLQSGTSVASAS